MQIPTRADSAPRARHLPPVRVPCSSAHNSCVASAMLLLTTKIEASVILSLSVHNGGS